MAFRAKQDIFFISLGCPKNLVDSEHMLGYLNQAGYRCTDNIEDASVCIINTCGFIREAVEESIDTILEAVKFKINGSLEKLIVTGCMVQRYGYKLRREMPEVDAWLGTNEFIRILDVMEFDISEDKVPFFISRPLYLADHSTPRLLSTPFYTAYIKIAEGCSHRCSFCTIPAMRGPFRSRSVESVEAEAINLVEHGVREINLVAQDTTMYGRDQNFSIEDLLERLVTIRDLNWIRILYCYPDGVSERLLDIMDSEEKICPYLDIPLQHVNRDILVNMRRPPVSETPWELVNRIRGHRRKISLRTSLMVGFPGETESAFNELYSFVKDARFDHLGVFVFSREEGTSAGRIRNDVSPEMAIRRKEEIMSLQAKISEEINRELIGQVVPVLIEGQSEETDLLLKGRSAFMAPDIDGQILINKGEGVYGKIMPVLIKEAYSYDLIGEIK